MVRDSRIILCHSELNTAFFIARFVVNRTSCRFILFIYKFVWLNKSACSITLTIIQQLKFLGQILSTEKDGPANIYTLHEPSHGRTTPERQQKPFSEPCSGMDRPIRTFLRGQHRAHSPKTEPVWDVDLQLAAPQSTHDMMMMITNRIGLHPVLLTILIVLWVGGEILLLGKTTKTLDSSFGFLASLCFSRDFHMI